MNKHSPSIFLLSGKSGAGKTTLCSRTVALLQDAGVQVAGLLSPARIERNRKTGIFVRDIVSGQQRLLAGKHSRGRGAGLGWRFDPDALRWGSKILKSAAPSDVLVVDELGPLELKQDEGWTVAWEVLNANRFAAALIVVRPSLIESLKKRLEGHVLKIVSVTSSRRTAESLSQSILSSIVREANAH